MKRRSPELRSSPRKQGPRAADCGRWIPACAGMSGMGRRDFITLLVGAAAVWPLAARAQQAGKPATIGLLGSGTAAGQSQWTAAFVQRMRELGWIEGRNLTIEYRWAEGHIERLTDLANELVRLKVDVIVTHNARLPTMHLVREYVEAGGLIAYGPNWPHMWRRAADLVDKILHGAKPTDIPVEQPAKFDLVINLTTAKALGLTVPDRLLAIADEVIE
jgi:ABC-type uncharacterized transport system substrate-binding protein